MKLALLGYSWTWCSNKKIDPFMEEIVQSFAKLGVDVDIYIGNHFTKDGGIHGISPAVNINKFTKYIQEQKYDLAVSFNNSLISKKFIEAFGCKVVSWIVDDFLHLFNHDGGDKFTTFRQKFEVMLISSEMQDKILEAIPESSSRLHFFPPATTILSENERRIAFKYPISWIASYLDSKHIENIFNIYLTDTKKYNLLRTCINEVKNNQGDGLKLLRHDSEVDDLLRSYNCNVDFFEMQLQNMASNHNRLAIVIRLSKYGLALFGNSDWISTFSNNEEAIDSFQAGKLVTEHQQLMNIYNSSKISINSPQTQAGSALQYRVIDIMASNSLLITKYNENSDLFRVFGKDCPVPMYKDLQELEDLCAYYLQHEDERLKLVNKCNALVANGFSFADRCNDIMKIGGVDIDKLSAVKQGKIEQISAKLFFNKSSILKKSTLSFIRRALNKLIRLTITPYMRQKITNIIKSAY